MLALAGAAALGAGVYVIAKPSATTTAPPTAPRPPGPAQTVIITPIGGSLPRSLHKPARIYRRRPSPMSADLADHVVVILRRRLGSNPSIEPHSRCAARRWNRRVPIEVRELCNSTATYQPPASDPTGAWAVAHAFQLIVAANPITSATTPTPPTGTGRPGTMLIGGPRGGFAGYRARAALPVRLSDLGRAGLGW